MPSAAYTWMYQTVSRAGKKMSRFVNWSIAPLSSRFSRTIVFVPALDFNYFVAQDNACTRVYSENGCSEYRL